MEATRRLADDVLGPTAEATDQGATVPASHVEALAAAGLFGLVGPVSHGGADAPLAVRREIYEMLAGACGVTFFVWTQHHSPVRMLAGSPNAVLRERYLADLCAGRLLGGVAFAYLRRPGSPAVAARTVPGGYRVVGEAPWVSSWGSAGVYTVAARCDGRIVWFSLTPEAGKESVRASEPLRLAAMNASSTVRLAFDDLFVPDDDVMSVEDVADWHSRDRVATAQPQPGVFGLAATACRLLRELDDDAGAALEQELAGCRHRSYELADAAQPDEEHLEALVEARAWSLDVAVRSAAALVSASGGRAMDRGHPAQRLLREAAFFSIQAQTAAVRKATLARLQPRRS
ncbi:MAG: acyl-CoA dehydrogenase family protein [Acidimicrobiales bacterium]